MGVRTCNLLCLDSGIKDACRARWRCVLEHKGANIETIEGRLGVTWVIDRFGKVKTMGISLNWRRLGCGRFRGVKMRVRLQLAVFLVSL